MKSSVSAFFKRFHPSDEFLEQLSVTVKYAAFYLIALIYWEILLRIQTGFENISFYFLLFLPAIAVFLSTLTGWFKRKGKHNFNRFLTPIVMLIPFMYYIAQLIYFRVFGSLCSVSMLGMGTDALDDFGWTISGIVADSIGWIILFILPVAVTILLSVFAPDGLFASFSPKMHLFSFIQVFYLWFFAFFMLFPFGKGDFSPYYAYTSSYIDTDTAAGRLGALTNSVVELAHITFGSQGTENDNTLVIPDDFNDDFNDDIVTDNTVDISPNIIESIDFNALKSQTDDKDKQNLCEYFASLNGTNKNQYTGMLEGYNLIYICAESFSSYAIDPEITPTLYKMSSGGFVLNNYYNAFKNTTTNGEFAFLTGLWPDVSRKADSNSSSGSFVQSKNNYMPYSFANMFNNIGANTYGYHNFRGYYYQRDKTHKNLGYKTLRFMGGTNGMKFTTSWPTSDFEMLQQSIDDYINDEQFHTYYMTFSGHGPYSESNPIALRNYEKVNQLLGDRELSVNAKYYLAANYDLEKAMTLLLEKLEAAGKLDKTMIIIAGDHYPYYLSDRDYNALVGHKVDTNFEKFQSTCIMYCSGIETVQVDTPCCNVDILPTVLNLFGMEFDSRLLAGTDIFSNNTHIAMLYNKGFITDKVKYNASSGKAEWLPAADSLSEEDREKYLNYCISTTKLNYTASLNIVNEDYYKFIADKKSAPTE